MENWFLIIQGNNSHCRSRTLGSWTYLVWRGMWSVNSILAEIFVETKLQFEGIILYGINIVPSMHMKMSDFQSCKKLRQSAMPRFFRMPLQQYYSSYLNSLSRRTTDICGAPYLQVAIAALLTSRFNNLLLPVKFCLERRFFVEVFDEELLFFWKTALFHSVHHRIYLKKQGTINSNQRKTNSQVGNPHTNTGTRGNTRTQ